MSACSQCGHDEDFIKCDFLGCQDEAKYEGWYRVVDFAGQPTGLIKKRVCRSCVKLLIGNSPTKHAPSHENKIMEHEHILKWSNIERVIYCEDEECDYLINDRQILDIIKENQ